MLTKTMISANHMWFRTSMAGGILLKLVSRHWNSCWISSIKKGRICQRSWQKKTMMLDALLQVWPLHTLCTNFQAACSRCLWCAFPIRQNPRFIGKVPWLSGWRDVMGIAAIDCAQEENMPTCREYEVTIDQIWKGDWSSSHFRWWGTQASSSSHREPLQGTWGRRGLVGTSQFLLSRWSNGVGGLMEWDLNVIPPERHGGLPEGAAGEEGEGRERMAQSLASWVSQIFVILKIRQNSFFFYIIFKGGEWKHRGSLGRWGSSCNNYGWRGL